MQCVVPAQLEGRIEEGGGNGQREQHQADEHEYPGEVVEDGPLPVLVLEAHLHLDEMAAADVDDAQQQTEQQHAHRVPRGVQEQGELVRGAKDHIEVQSEEGAHQHTPHHGGKSPPEEDHSQALEAPRGLFQLQKQPGAQREDQAVARVGKHDAEQEDIERRHVGRGVDAPGVRQGVEVDEGLKGRVESVVLQHRGRHLVLRRVPILRIVGVGDGLDGPLHLIHLVRPDPALQAKDGNILLHLGVGGQVVPLDQQGVRRVFQHVQADAAALQLVLKLDKPLFSGDLVLFEGQHGLLGGALHFGEGYVGPADGLEEPGHQAGVLLEAGQHRRPSPRLAVKLGADGLLLPDGRLRRRIHEAGEVLGEFGGDDGRHVLVEIRPGHEGRIGGAVLLEPPLDLLLLLQDGADMPGGFLSLLHVQLHLLQLLRPGRGQEPRLFGVGLDGGQGLGEAADPLRCLVETPRPLAPIVIGGDADELHGAGLLEGPQDFRLLLADAHQGEALHGYDHTCVSTLSIR